MKVVFALSLCLLAGLAMAKPGPRQVTFSPPTVVPIPSPSPPPPAPGTPPAPTYNAPGLDFSFIIPGFTTSSFNTAQQNALCSAVTNNFNSSSRGVTCTIGSVSSFNSSNVLVSGYAYFTFNSVPSVTDLQTAAALRDARVQALTENVGSILGGSFPGANPNCACNGVSPVSKSSTSSFNYNTNITGVPGPLQCDARLTYDSTNPNAVVNQVGVDDGSTTNSNLGKYCSNPVIPGGVSGTPGSGSCRQYGVIASGAGTVQATATAVVTGGVVSGTTGLAGGNGYESAPTVTVGAPNPVAAQVAFTLNTANQPTGGATPSSASNGPYTAGPTVATLSNTCLDTAYTGAGAHCTGAVVTYQINGVPQTGATCTAANIAAATIDGTGSINGGLTFPGAAIVFCTIAPTVTLSTNTLQTAATAQITATVSGGSVTALNVVSPGSGYRSPPTITIAAPTSNSLGKLCSPAPIAGLSSNIASSTPQSIDTTGPCQPLGRDTYLNRVCSTPAAPNGTYAMLNAFTCNVVSSFINQPGSTATTPCGVIAQSFVTTIASAPTPAPGPAPTPAPAPAPVPAPAVAPTPAPAPAPVVLNCVYQNEYFIESVACTGKFIAFRTEKSQCKNTTLMLRTASQSKGNRRVWRLNAAATTGRVPGAAPVIAYGKISSCPTSKYTNLAAANSSPTPRLAGSSWKNRIIPVDASKGCNVVWIQAAGDNPYAGKYLGYGNCQSQTAFGWQVASSSSAIQWRLTKASP